MYTISLSQTEDWPKWVLPRVPLAAKLKKGHS
jgi:hypothetical protein